MISKTGRFLVLAILLVPATSFSTTLTFDDATCGGGSACLGGGLIDQSYGDSIELDIQWDAQIGGSLEDFYFWGVGYSGLTDIAYGRSSQTAEIFLDVAPGYQVTLQGLDLSSSVSEATSQVTILTGTNQVLYSSGTIAIPGLTTFDQSDFSIDLTSGDGIRLQFGPDAYNVGIDNIEFFVSPEPEPLITPIPAAAWLFGSALLGLVAVQRKRT